MRWMKSMQRFSLSWNANCTIESHPLITHHAISTACDTMVSCYFVRLGHTVNIYSFFAHARCVLCSWYIAPWWKTHIACSYVLKLSSNKSRYHALTILQMCSELCISTINTVFFWDNIFKRLKCWRFVCLLSDYGWCDGTSHCIDIPY